MAMNCGSLNPVFPPPITAIGEALPFALAANTVMVFALAARFQASPNHRRVSS